MHMSVSNTLPMTFKGDIGERHCIMLPLGLTLEVNEVSCGLSNAKFPGAVREGLG